MKLFRINKDIHSILYDAAAARRALTGDITSAADQILAEGSLPD